MSLFASFGLSTSVRPLSLLHPRKLFSCSRASLTLSKCIHNKKRLDHSQIKDQLDCNYNVKFTVYFSRRQFISGHCKHLLMKQKTNISIQCCVSIRGNIEGGYAYILNLGAVYLAAARSLLYPSLTKLLDPN